ncbi:MFS transporter [Mycolicibacterium parafortuitum]|uniref:Permease, MFS superfamily [Gordonia sp. KTR9] n=1 Tax=Mycolicibacterium parafortuitum TaxID=39692 RepID=A0A375YBI7_MYCPF|nr:MFS transporter [Mycolicibacterium parafortuitum]ORB31880.1 MFS transporter [Mycolicibacterium parafortuitum]SRX78465.1 Permease, MFS superfamily [Gordonia sp. KTR9] [Mycolicibacterium parafortuitum]
MTAVVGAQASTGRSRRWAAVAAATFAIAWGGNEFTPLLVMYRTEGGFSPVTVDLLLFAYVLGIVPALLIGGPLSDRFGRRPLMLPAPVLAGIGSLILAVGAESAWTLGVGRVFSGLALGLAMAVGGSWIKELSTPPWDAGDAGARRAAMSLTAGFGFGAAVAGALAQWGPAPTVLPYAINAVMALVAAALLITAPETRRRSDPGAASGKPWWSDLAIPSASHRRFLFVVVPVAPWVFGAGASAYAVLPALMTEHVGAAPIAFSALLCAVTLGVGFAVQHLGRHIVADGRRGTLVALVLVAVGMALAVAAASLLTVWAALIAAAALGAGYGMALLAGLQEIQRIATADDLAGLTAVFYSLSYLGFGVPAAMALLAAHVSYPVMFGFGALAAGVCVIVAVAGSRRTAALS